MKIRSLIAGLIVLVAVLIALLFWFAKSRPVEAPPATSLASTVPSTPVTARTNALPTPASSNAPATADQPDSAPPQDKVQVLKNILQANNANIAFYGRLEDQFGNPVSGADIQFSIQYENANARGIQRGQVAADGNGFFTISGYKGANLTVMPKKAGYALTMTGTTFRYSQLSPGYFVPDASNPTVIKMWKLQGAEPLVGIDKTYKLHYTANPICFDLIAGQTVPAGGDLKITVNRPAGIISGRNPQDWNIDVEVTGGGFIETLPSESAMTYAAPESGYQPSGKFGKNNGPDLVDKTLFIQSRNGQVYSKVHLLFGINDTQDGFMYVTFSGVANTNGSRNWEATAPQ